MHLTVVSSQIVFRNILGANLAFFQIIRAQIFTQLPSDGFQKIDQGGIDIQGTGA